MSKLRENWLACTKKCRALVQLQCFVAALEVECLFYGDLLCRIVRNSASAGSPSDIHMLRGTTGDQTRFSALQEELSVR